MSTKIRETENRIPSVASLVTTVALNTKVIDTEKKVPDIANLATKAGVKTKLQRLNIKDQILLI